MSDFEKMLAFHCSPAFMGIKASNLVSCDLKKFNNVEIYLKTLNNQLNNKGIYFDIICLCQNRVLILVYKKKLLCSVINEQENYEFLKDIGYPMHLGFDEVMSHLKIRVKNNKDFPHEIGIFLGYPLEDIKGFLKNKGKNFKMCGYWKVYSDEERAIKLFNKYTHCRKVILRTISLGKDIVSLCKA